MSKINVGVVGYGFVGRAVANGFKNQNVIIIDPNEGTSTQDLLDQKPDVVFICVPTPMGVDGVIDASIVEHVLFELKDLDTLLVLKSTVVPDIVERLSLQYKNFIYNPEFLTEANASRDFQFPFLHVFGGEKEYCDKLHNIYLKYSICGPCEVQKMSAKEASFVKYSINSYLALKVIFWNQMKEVIEAAGANYDTVRGGFICDPRIGGSHSMVPGPDGRKGAASSCFAKDIPALVRYSNNSLSILREAWNVNCDIRNSYGDVLPREKAQHIVFNKI